MLVGNKLDLESSRKVSKEMAEQYAEEEGLLFAEASAKNGDGVEQLFLDIGTPINPCLKSSVSELTVKLRSCLSTPRPSEIQQMERVSVSPDRPPTRRPRVAAEQVNHRPDVLA